MKKNKAQNVTKNVQENIPIIEKGKSNFMLDLLVSVLLIAYGYVTVLTPNWLAFDSNAPKFYTFAILNLVVSVIVFAIKDFRENNKILFGFFTNKIGIAYSVMMFFALLSFTKVINVEEGVLHFFKVFTAFSAAWMVASMVIYNPKCLTPLAAAMTLLLFYDVSVTVEGIKDIIKEVSMDYNIKGSYSNKNILASAIFIKIPFAVWLFYFHRNWLRVLGGAGILLGTLAVFFMSTRAFYLATFIVLITLIIHVLINYFLFKRKKLAVKLGFHVLFVAIAFGIFTFVQNVMYPQNIRENTSFSARLATIADQENMSNNLRKTAWTTTFTGMIPNDPLLGVGIGNWKVRYLEYENSYSPHYIYMYKAHNDFLEVTSEIGIIGGLAFVSIFFLIAYYFFRGSYKNKSDELEKWFSLPLLGLFAYSFDAFFNFPQDRPEIQALFAIFVGIAVGLGVTHFSKNTQVKKNNMVLVGLLSVLTIVMGFANVVVEKMYFDSSKIQRMVKEEQQGVRQVKSPAQKLIQDYPKIPNLTAVAEPVDVEKARYLIDEKKFDEARKVLASIKYHPFDGRPEYFTAVSYFMEENKKFDSIYKYANKARMVKPNFFGNVNLETFALNNLGREKESIEILKEFLSLKKDTVAVEIPKWKKVLKERFHVDVDKSGRRDNRKEAQAWNSLAYLQEKNGLLVDAKATLDSAVVYLPEDKIIVNNRNKITSRISVEQFLPMFNEAALAYQGQRYAEAIPLFSKFLEKVPAYTEALRLRGICYYFEKQYQKAINDFSLMEELGTPLNAVTNNFRASCYYMVGDRANAKIFFQKAASEGSVDAQKNLQNLTF